MSAANREHGNGKGKTAMTIHHMKYFKTDRVELGTFPPIGRVARLLFYFCPAVELGYKKKTCITFSQQTGEGETKISGVRGPAASFSP